MNMKKVTLAAAILFALTGCGSSGGGSNNPTSNSEINNNQATQTQADKQKAEAEKQKAEVEALKNQLAQAQANQKQAEDKLKSAEKTHNQDLTKAKNNLAAAQANLANVQATLKQVEAKLAEQQSGENNKALQNQLNEATQKLSAAQQEKLLAEKELNDKLAEENKLMTRAEVLDFALHNGLYKEDSEEFADDYQNKPKSFVIDQLVYTHKIIAMKNLARRYGLPEVDVRAFTKENKNKTLEEAAKILDNQREEIAKKRETLLNELFTIAKEKGLEDWEANNFVYGRNHTDKEKALEDLNNYLNEKAERETKLNELIQLAKEKGLEDWEASNFANSHINTERAKALEELNKLATKKEKENALRELAKQYNVEIDSIFIENNLDKPVDKQILALYDLEKRKDSLVREFDLNDVEKYKIIQTTFPQIDNSGSLLDRSAKVYNQNYSIIYGLYAKSTYNNYEQNIRESFSGNDEGLKTKELGLPTEGKAIYSGKALNYESDGNLTYNVDFTKRVGSGKITGIENYGDITLEEADIKVRNLTREAAIPNGKASSALANEREGSYSINFYGPHAEELGGKVYFSFGYDAKTPSIDAGVGSTYILFGGTRGEIQK